MDVGGQKEISCVNKEGQFLCSLVIIVSFVFK